MTQIGTPREAAAGQEPPINTRWKWTASLGNLAVGAAEILTGNMSTWSVTADGLHNLGDGVTYYTQADNVIHQNDLAGQGRRMRLHEAAYWTISLMSAATAIKTGVDWSLDHESAPHDMAVYTASASLALNGVLLTRLHQGLQRKQGRATIFERVLSKHFWGVDIPSAGLALAGALLQKHNVDVEQGLAAANGILGAVVFRPTKKNMYGKRQHGHGH